MGAPEKSQSQNLQAAFADFEVASTQLATFYQNLETQVAQLTRELDKARAAEIQQLRENEIVAGRLGSLLEALPAGVVVLDGQGCIAEFNPAAQELLGPLRSGGRWIDVVADAFQPRWDDGHDISLRDGRRVNIATQALHDEPGQILLLKDVSETRRLQEMLNHHRRISAKTELAAALAHQIRTPLSAAVLHTSNLSSRSCEQTGHRHSAVRALDSMRQLERLVEDMLMFARGGKFDGEAIDLPELMESLAKNIAATTEGGHYSVDISSDVPQLQLFGNTDALISMMLNLVNNARSASNGSGRMRIQFEQTQTTIDISFEDDGPGIATHDAERIFEPFFTNSSSGTGLGLAVALSIARAHDGDLTLDKTFDTGAKFVLSLPIPRLTMTMGARVNRAASDTENL